MVSKRKAEQFISIKAEIGGVSDYSSKGCEYFREHSNKLFLSIM